MTIEKPLNIPESAELASIESKIEAAVAQLKTGRMIIIVDDEERENEGDFVIPAEDVTPSAITFLSNNARGLICTPMISSDLKRLALPLMVPDANKTAFTISVDAAEGITTGISSADRAQTIKLLADRKSVRSDFITPGHVFPLKYQDGGVLVRAGHTESSIDLLNIAGKRPVAAICEIMNPDGTMSRLPDLKKISSKYGIPIVSVADIISWRLAHETLIERVSQVNMPTVFGEFQAFLYKSKVDKANYIALVMGNISSDKPTMVRVHSECLTGDVFGSLRCECGQQLSLALKAISNEGTGVFVYMPQEGRGIGLLNKIRAYELQDQGLDTVQANEHLGFPPDLRRYGIGAQILIDLGIRKFRLLTNNPKKIAGLKGFQLEMVEVIPILAPPNQFNESYLKTKKSKLDHHLPNITL